MSFDDILSSDAINTILNTSENAESIGYTALDSAEATINAIIEREAIEPGSEDQGRILQRQVKIQIANDADSGMSSIDIKNDKVSFPIRKGGTAVDWAVIEIVSKDAGLWILRVQR